MTRPPGEQVIVLQTPTQPALSPTRQPTPAQPPSFAVDLPEDVGLSRSSHPLPSSKAERRAVQTPVVDLTDYTVYRQTLLEAFAADADRLPNAPHYFIQARLLPGEVPLLAATQRMHITNQEQTDLNELYFRLYPNLPAYAGTAEVWQVVVDNQRLDATTTLENSALWVPLAGRMRPGASTDVTLWFTATLPTSVAPSIAGSGLYGFVDSVYDLAGFYPTLMVYDDEGWNLDIPTTYGDAPFTAIGFYQVELTVPSEHAVVASGSTVAQQANDDGTTTWHIAAGPVRSFYAAVTDRWQVISEDVNGIMVNSYYPSAALPSAQTVLAYTTASLRTFNRLLGPYPYRELDVVPLPTTGFGMEYAGLFALAASFYTEAGGPFVIATPHEVAHQWFFNLVGNDQPDEPWLDESLANYAVYLYYEAVDWPEMQTAMLENVFHYRYNRAQELGIDRPVSGPVVGFDQANYINIVYSKGPLFFHAMRERLGDDAFFAALRDYTNRHRYHIAYADDLFDTFRRHSDTPFDDLIAFWITGK